MTPLRLTAEEAAMLHEILESDLTELRSEITHTDSSEFREGLKRREEFLKRLLRQLDTPGVAAG